MSRVSSKSQCTKMRCGKMHAPSMDNSCLNNLHPACAKLRTSLETSKPTRFRAILWTISMVLSLTHGLAEDCNRTEEFSITACDRLHCTKSHKKMDYLEAIVVEVRSAN
eukprot:Trichotokara_eunicae@DN4654_c0_g1_i1.p2